MNPDAGHAWFRIASAITLMSVALIFFTEPGTAERIVSVFTLIIGLLFIGAIVLLVRRNR